LKGYFTYDTQSGYQVYYVERIGAKPNNSNSLPDWYRYVRVLSEEQRLVNKINEEDYLGTMFQLVHGDDIFRKASVSEEEVDISLCDLQNWINMAIDWMYEQSRDGIGDMSRWLHEIERQCYLLARLLGLKYRDELFSCVLFKRKAKHILVHVEMNEKSDFTYIGGITNDVNS